MNNVYGCTELGGTFATDCPNIDGIDTVGRLLSGYTVKIIDDDGHRYGIGTDGEICVKGPFKFLGYYQDDALTEQVVDNEGFFHTGDIGHFDKDGNLCLVGRKKDILGAPCRISPHEIEEFVIKSPEVKMVCVVGVYQEVGHEVPAAMIVREEISDIAEEDIVNMVEGILSILFE